MRKARLALIPAIVAACQISGFAHAGDSDLSALHGKDIYDSYCGPCHGFNGSPLLPHTPDFSVGERMEKSDSELLESIRAGKGKAMPAWLGILSEKECEEVLQFIRETIS